MQVDEFELEIEKVKEKIAKKYENIGENINSKNAVGYYYAPLKDVAKCLMEAELITLYMSKSLLGHEDKMLLENKNSLLKIYIETEKMRVLLGCILDSFADIFTK